MRIWAAAPVAIVGAAVVLGAGPAYADSPVYRVSLGNLNSGQCLETGGVGGYAWAYQNACHAGDTSGYDQEWVLTLSPGARDVYSIQNLASGRCLDLSGSDNFSVVVENPCNGGANQAWQQINFPPSIGGRLCTWCAPVFELRNWAVGRCLEVGYYSTANYATTNLYDCYGGTNQKWYVGRAFYGYV